MELHPMQDANAAKVIPCDLINLFTFCPLWNHSKTEYIVALGNGVNAELNKLNIFATQLTGDVAIQLKSPASND